MPSPFRSRQGVRSRQTPDIALREISDRAGGGAGLERVAGIEPAYSAWKAAALPLSYTRARRFPASEVPTAKLVEGAGFEPAYAKRSDLQSDGFNHSPTPPQPRPSWARGRGAPQQGRPRGGLCGSALLMSTRNAHASLPNRTYSLIGILRLIVSSCVLTRIR